MFYVSEMLGQGKELHIGVCGVNCARCIGININFEYRVCYFIDFIKKLMAKTVSPMHSISRKHKVIYFFKNYLPFF